MLVIEDGSVVVSANSYVTAAQLEAYAEARGITFTADPEVLAIKAMDFIESQRFVGVKTLQSQPLQWPRTGAYIDGFEVSTTTIPEELKNAQMATAVAIDTGYDPLAPLERGVVRQKVGSIEIEYDQGGMTASYSRAISAALKKLTLGSGGASNFTVSRA